MAKPPASFEEAMTSGAAGGSEVAPGGQRYENRPADGNGRYDSQLHERVLPCRARGFGMVEDF